jgi:hypothetical protein
MFTQEIISIFPCTFTYRAKKEEKNKIKTHQSEREKSKSRWFSVFTPTGLGNSFLSSSLSLSISPPFSTWRHLPRALQNIFYLYLKKFLP